MTTILISSIYTCSISKKKKISYCGSAVNMIQVQHLPDSYLLFTYLSDFSDNLWLHQKMLVALTQFWVKYGQTQPLDYVFKLHF